MDRRRTRCEAAFDEVFAEFTRLEKLMSTWIPDSDVSRVNREAGVRPVPVSADVREVLKTARQMSEWTGGKFDVTFGALSGLWKFDHDQDNVIPDMREVRRRLPLIDYRAIQIDDAAGTVFLAQKGMSIHLGGIGKGYAVDRGAAILRHRGLRDFMVQSGGDIYVAGLKDGRPWRLGIQDPRGPANRTFAELELTDGTFSTSGDYERSFVKNGRRYHHILDPATGEPARGARSVTIVVEPRRARRRSVDRRLHHGPRGRHGAHRAAARRRRGDRVGRERGADLVGASGQSQGRGAANGGAINEKE